MQKRRKLSLWVLLAALGAVVACGLIIDRLRHPVTISGAVTILDPDVRKQLPIAGVEITAANEAAVSPTKSDASGLFALKLRKWVRKGHPITLTFRHPNYQSLDTTETADGKLVVAHLLPIARKPNNIATVSISNVRVRYSIQATRTMSVGSATKAFEVNNTGNVPCDHHVPCSPDGKWKAALGSITLDAGLGNEFQNVRISCIAGPCPFTRIESDDLSQPSQKITAKVRNWSDTATFLVEAEVIHTMRSDIDYQSYPVIFGSNLNFTLPANAEGVSFEADLGGDTIIFPLGPNLLLSWADCNAAPNREGTIYRCELKPGYRFQ